MVASQAHGVRERTGLTRAQAEVAAWVVAESGVTVGGARAIGLAVAVAWQRRFVLWPWKVPGVPWLLDRCYDGVARVRRRLPGTTPWCVAHPGQCGSAEA